MQTKSKKIYRPDERTTNLGSLGFMTLPVIGCDAFTGCYEQASHQLFLASKELKQKSAKTITQSLKLNLINEIDINREFKKHDDGQIVEIELLNTLTNSCESKLRDTCLSDDYKVELDIEDGHCVLTGYHLHDVYIDTSSMSIGERAVIYSSLELVSRYQVPLMPPHWCMSATHGLIGELIDNDEFELLATFAMQYDSVDELVEFINDDELFEYLDYLLGQMDGCLSSCVSAILDYERMYKDCSLVNEYMDSEGLNYNDSDSTESLVTRHIARLKKIESPESTTLLLVLNRLLDSKIYTQFERLEMEDSQPLDLSLTIIDAPYNALINHMQEQMLDELNQVGEPLKEAILFSENTVERLNLLTDAFTELNKLNNGNEQ